MYNKNIKKILLTGGGTGGSVSPLLAIANQLKNTPFIKGGGGGFDFLFIGGKRGPEKEMVEKEGIEFRAISSGKLRRYFSLKNLTDPFLIIAGFLQAFFIILKWKPDLIISAGSFVSVPVVWAGRILRAPTLVHQQDARAGLANKLMAPFAKVITVTFKESLKDYGKKAVWTGNPARNMETCLPAGRRITHNAINKAPLIKGVGGFENNLPVVLVIGGGTGAMAINEMVWKSLDELTKFCNVIHITGKAKTPPLLKGPTCPVGRAGGIFSAINEISKNYNFFEFLDARQMAEAYAAADIVVSRAGMGVLTELSFLGKPAILIPMPDSHQEDNAKIFKNKEAAIVLNQKGLTPQILAKNIKNLLENNEMRAKLSGNIKKVVKANAEKEIANIIEKIINT